MKKHYVVLVGSETGIFDSWDTCKQKVHGYENAVYKGFKTLDDAQKYWNENNKPVETMITNVSDNAIDEASDDGVIEFQMATSKKKKSSDKKNKPKITLRKKKIAVSPKSGKNLHSQSELIVYTDGACSFNGRHEQADKIRAGVGVFFAENDPRNVSETFTLENPTNQRAEVYAAVRALQTIDKTHENIIIKTDSMYLINSMTNWLKNWVKNGWKTTTGSPVKNMDLFLVLSDLVSERKSVQFDHIKGHANLYGNFQADALAVQGANKQ